MKKNIIIGSLLIITCLSLMFASKQKSVAVVYKVEAINAKGRADSLNLILIREAERAQRNFERSTQMYQGTKEK